ncbi:MAG: DUF6671 family protein [Cyanobium sp.]
MALPSPYAGSSVALATRHGKERVIGRALRHGLGAELLHLPEIDTDQLGSFCGAVPRQGTALEACLAKARLTLSRGGTGLAIASEGSFGPHPAVPLLPVGIEWMVFLDPERELTISEQLLARRTNFASRTLSAADLIRTADNGAEGNASLELWLRGVGFPSHALIVRPHGAQEEAVRKGIHRQQELLAAIAEAAARSPQGAVQLETDMRAHCNPTRMASIRQLSFRLMRRIAAACPRCRSPGWGLVDTLPGLPCGWCGQPTALVGEEVHGCPRCGHREARPRRDGLRQADPGQCLHCNP